MPSAVGEARRPSARRRQRGGIPRPQGIHRTYSQRVSLAVGQPRHDMERGVGVAARYVFPIIQVWRVYRVLVLEDGGIVGIRPAQIESADAAPYGQSRGLSGQDGRRDGLRRAIGDRGFACPVTVQRPEPEGIANTVLKACYSVTPGADGGAGQVEPTAAAAHQERFPIPDLVLGNARIVGVGPGQRNPPVAGHGGEAGRGIRRGGPKLLLGLRGLADGLGGFRLDEFCGLRAVHLVAGLVGPGPGGPDGRGCRRRRRWFPCSAPAHSQGC